MRRAALHLASATFGVFCAVLVKAAFAVTPTGEHEALASHYRPLPLALSRDGRWIVHADGANVLRRTPVAGEGPAASVPLRRRPRALSVSADGAVAAVVVADGCVGIVRFDAKAGRGEKAAPAWLENAVVGLYPAVTCTADRSDDGGDSRNYHAAAVAVSRDGSRVAVGWDPVRIVDLRSNRIVHVVPTDNTEVLHLRFVDGDRKLFVVHAEMGEGYGSDSGPSDVQFAVWDLAKKDLVSFHRTGSRGNLLGYDLLWSFSERTGELWAINTDGRYWQVDRAGRQKDKRESIRPYRTNLKRCAPTRRSMPPLPPGDGDSWLAFAADPLGRYVAGVTPRYDEKNRTATLWVRESRTGKLLAEWPLDRDLYAVTLSSDGATLFALAGDDPYIREPKARDAAVLRFDLSRAIATLTPAKPASWPDRRCVIENEAPGAREVAFDAKTPRPLFETELVPPESTSSCYFEEFRVHRPTTWGRSPDGAVWIDGGTRVARISPATGRVLQQTVKPHGEKPCSVPLFERGHFLSWQGDTLTLRPFAKPAAAKVFVRKPGWIESGIALLQHGVGVRWVDRRHKGIPGEHPAGTALAIVYDMSGKPLSVTRGRAVGGDGASFEQDGPYSSVFDSAPRRPAPLAEGAYRWELSYMGSVRASRRDAASDPVATVMWSGLRLQGPAAARAQYDGSSASRVAGLSGPLGAHVHRTGVTVYDAERRRAVAMIRLERVRNIAWDAEERVLLVETIESDAQKGRYGTLRGYRIEM